MAAVSRRPYGVGLGYRAELHHQILRHASEIDVLEVPTEEYVSRFRRLVTDRDGRRLREALDRIPGVAHGIHMSIGSVEPHLQPALDETISVLREYGLDVFSEHLAYHRMGGKDLLMFQCLPFQEASARWVAGKYRQVRRRLSQPMALENVSYSLAPPECAMGEAEFLTRVTELTDCRLLLDVTNIFNNATNHGYDPLEFIRRLPGERVSQLHLAGGHFSDGKWQDSHSKPVMAPVWDLLHEVLRQTAAEVVVLERDSNFEHFDSIMDDVRKARRIFYQHRPERPPAQAPSPPTGAAAEGDGEGLDGLLTDPDVQQLRQFQAALLAAVADPDVRARWAEDPAAVATQFGLEGAWRRRWLGFDRAGVSALQRKWRGVEAFLRQKAEYYERLEWEEWAKQTRRGS